MKGKAKKAKSNARYLPSSGRDSVIRKLKNINKNNKQKATLKVILFDARGLFLVLKTFLSMFLSHISFAMHPNPLTNKPPKIIFITIR